MFPHLRGTLTLAIHIVKYKFLFDIYNFSMDKNIELRQLRYFVAIVEAGSLSAASRTLHIAQPALSHHLRLLENSLGQPLLYRQPRGVQVTPAGDKLFRHAFGVLRQLQGLKAAVSTVEPLSGPVAVGVPRTIGGLLSLPFFEKVQKLHPGIVLEIVDGHSRDLGRALLEGRVDLVVMMPPAPPDGVIEMPLLTEEVLLVSRADAPWLGNSKTLDIADLPTIPMLLPSRRERLGALLKLLGVKDALDFNVRGHIDDLSALLAAVQAGHGAAVLPMSAISQAPAHYALRTRRLKGRPLLRHLILCRARGVMPREATLVVAQDLLEVIDTLVQSGQWPTAKILRRDWSTFLDDANRSQRGSGF